MILELKNYFLLRAILCISIAFLISSNILSQTGKTFSNDADAFINTGGSIFTSPASFRGIDWLTLGGTVGLTTIAHLFDREVHQKAIEASKLNYMHREDEELIIYSLLGSSLAIYGYGLLSKNQQFRQTGLSLLTSVFYSGAITGGLKLIVGRSRPYTNDSPVVLTPFSINYESTSFPSGHATIAFAFATVLAMRSSNIFLKTGCYTFATYISLSRIFHNQHWLSDIVFGAAIGYFIGSFSEKKIAEKFNNEQNISDLEFSFVISL